MQNIKINRKEFLNALVVGASLAGRAKTLPILDCVKIKVKKDSIEVVSMDMDSAIKKTCPIIEVDEQFVFAVNAKDILSLTKAIKDENIIITYSNNEIIVKHQKGVVSLPTMPSDEFPNIERGDIVGEFTMEPTKLSQWLNIAKNFTSNDAFHAAMGAVYLEVKDGVATICATDSKKLYSEEVEILEKDVNTSALISSNVLNQIQSSINGKQLCKITIDKSYASFTSEDSTICTRMVEGRYPNFRAVIPKSQKIFVDTNKEDFVDSITRVSICCATNNIVKIDVKSNTINITSQDIDFNKRAEESVICGHEGEDITLGFNQVILSQLLSCIESDKICFAINTNSTAVLIKDDCNPKKTILLMPMRIDY